MAKTGLVVEGGGMRCAYSSGILDRFMEEGVTFDYCIGVSAGAANVASYVAGQKGRNIRFYTEYIDRPEYFGLRSFIKTKNLFGLDYIYGTLSNSDGEDPIDYPAMISSPSEFKVSATEAETGKTVYFSKEEMIQDNYCHIRATCAIPAACRPVEIDGHFYYDGGVSESIPARKALEDGCDKVVVILSKPRDFVRKPQSLKFAYKTMCRQYPEIVKKIDTRHIKYREEKDELFAFEKEGRAFIFAQDDSVKVMTCSMSKKKEMMLYEMGIDHYNQRQQALKTFLEG